MQTVYRAGAHAEEAAMATLVSEALAKPIGPWEHDDPETSFTLPSRYFYDPAIFAEEKRKIFFKAWHLAAHRNEVAEPGQYVVCDVFEQSVIVIRGADGLARAFHNVCQHRGHRLLSERRGRIGPVLTCPYHAWAYGSDGRLRSAPRCERVRGFDTSRVALSPVRLEEFAGFLFVNLDPGAEPMSSAMAGADRAIRAKCPDLDDFRLVGEKDFHVDANWKVVQDNAIEGYHFDRSGPVHKELVALIDFDRYALEAHGRWWTFMSPPRPGTTRAFGEAIGQARYQTDWFFNINLWPHNTLYCFPYADFLGTFLMIPTGPERTLLRLGYYAPPRPASDVTRSCMHWMNEKLGPEDISLNVGVQLGIKSLGFDQGRYMIDPERSNESEHLLHHFHSLVHRALHGN
jgi:phenylpropionate dioxygenase-like ring-hydroxylating dioxygenase large terminal subunit